MQNYVEITTTAKCSFKRMLTIEVTSSTELKSDTDPILMPLMNSGKKKKEKKNQIRRIGRRVVLGWRLTCR